jgi:hypothetical protein
MLADKKEILKHYLIAGLWATPDNDENEFLDGLYSLEDISLQALKSSIKDINTFMLKAKDILKGLNISNDQIGHDIFLTRNGHGAGFWDRGLGETGEKLTLICDELKEVNLYAGDDKKIYIA